MRVEKTSTSDVKTERQEGSFMNQNQNRGIDALHGGLAVYDGSTDKFVFQYCSDTLVKLICGDRSEFEALTRGNALQIVCECDREQVEQALRVAREEHTELSTHFWLKRQGRAVRSGVIWWDGWWERSSRCCSPDYLRRSSCFSTLSVNRRTIFM